MQVRRSSWGELPANVRAFIERYTGPVDVVLVPEAGRNSDFAAGLHSSSGEPLAFVKGSSQPRTSLGREVLAATAHHPNSPDLLWHGKADRWTLAGFRCLSGRHADLMDPADLRRLAVAIAVERSAPPSLPSITSAWKAVWPDVLASEVPLPAGMRRDASLASIEEAAFSAMDGTVLAHTDLNPYNVLIDDKVWFVDWAWAAAAAPWLDAALTVPRLIAAGHSVPAAEAWAATVPAYADVAAETLASFSVANLGRLIWLRQAGRKVPQRQINQAHTWADYRRELIGKMPL